MPCRSRSGSRRPAFTLIELIAVIVVLAILAGVALPKVLDLRADAEESAADGTIGTVITSLNNAFSHHRVNDAPESGWILTIEDIAGVMDTSMLPQGLTIDGGQVVDQAGRHWDFIAETESEPARLVEDEDAGGVGPGQGGSGGGSAG